jgi:hypothetical protein
MMHGFLHPAADHDAPVLRDRQSVGGDERGQEERRGQAA